MPELTTENHGPRIGCAGWTIPAPFAAQFVSEGSHLEKYASRFSAVEINSSFYRLHREQTYARWAASVPANFLFSVKVPKQITHELALRRARTALEEFLATVAGLGSKLGVLLVQLPPSLAFDSRTARSFFKHLLEQTRTPVVCEPRHVSWFAPKALDVLHSLGVGLVIADPPPVSGMARPQPTTALTYYRFHGSPRVYYSRYSLDFLRSLANEIRAQPNAWCIFDNTALNWATQNAFELQELLGFIAARPRSSGSRSPAAQSVARGAAGSRATSRGRRSPP